MDAFDFFGPTRIVFGRGRLGELGALAAAWGRRCLLVTGARSLDEGGRRDGIERALRDAGLGVVGFRVAGEPGVEVADRGAELARRERADVIVAVGGGSVLDAAKAVSVLATNGGTALDYLEVIGAGRPLRRPGLPVIAVPTTAGTGAEVTRNAVLGHAGSRRKASLRGVHLLPRVALVDPSLTDSLPPGLTAATGLDCLTQLVEAYLSRRANPMTDALALEGVRRAVRALPRACRDPGDREARDDMALAALLSGLALTSAGLGAVHGLSGPLGGAFPIPHGLACAALLPPVFALNARRLLAEGGDEGPAGRRLALLSAALLGAETPAADVPAGEIGPAPAGPRDAARLAERAAARLRDLCAALGVPRLGAFGVRPSDLPALARQARQSSSTRTNPVDLSPEELEEVLAQAL